MAPQYIVGGCLGAKNVAPLPGSLFWHLQQTAYYPKPAGEIFDWVGVGIVGVGLVCFKCWAVLDKHFVVVRLDWKLTWGEPLVAASRQSK